MYEIWLMLNIVWELALAVWPWLAALLALWIVFLLMARGRSGATWRGAFPGAIVLGVLVAVIIFFITPGWSKSSLGDMKYWVDWANLLGIAAGWGAAAVILSWPLLTSLRRPR